MHSPSTSFLFGEVEIQPDQNTVIKEGVGHQLPARAMDVLIYLIKHNDRVVSGGELLDTFWVGRVVEESTIHRQISKIRIAVGDSAREAKYIKTVSKRGYQAVAPVIKQAVVPLEKDAEIIAVKENEFAGQDKERPHVCVSYAYQDAAVVREAIKPLERQGVNVWHEKGGPTEANIPSVIDLSLSGSSALLFFVSRRSIVSERCNQEIRLAKNENVAIIPVYLEDVELTSELKEELARQQGLGRKEQALRTQLLHILSGSQIGNVSTSKATPEKSVNPRWLNTSVGFSLLVLAGFLSIQMLVNKSALSGLLNQNREPRETIAVLPFNSLSERDSVGFFAEGLSHSILTDLVDIGHMIVAPQTAVLQLYQQDLELAELASTL
ncbi:MAG: TIR domain-containing protein, partial [Pseudomonadales bacterium]|nr:TIR domain-containing protein [Pseudomonadales bacterium]